MSLEFTWTKTPESLKPAIDALIQRINRNVLRVVEVTGIEAAGQMKRERPWRDISGNARKGLRCETELKDRVVTLYFIHSVEYGEHLELGHAGRYAVLVPTLHKTVPRLQRRLRKVAER